MAATCTVELHDLTQPSPAVTKSTDLDLPRGGSSGHGSQDSNRVLGEIGGCQPDPEPRTGVTQKWNEPRSNMIRMGATWWTFFIMGANDAAYGPLLPFLEDYYNIDHTIVSLVFLSPFIGYVASALLNNALHLRFGQRGAAVVSSLSHLVAYVVISLHPPFVVLVFAFILAGFGNGTADAAWNAWVGSLANPSELLGFLHSWYGAGGVMAPLVATALVTKANVEWYYFYYMMVGLAAFELGSLTWTFWKANGAAYRSIYRENEIERETGLSDALWRMPAARVSWTCALFLLGYVGVEVALGGWIVVFMRDVRHGEPFASGMSATGFWLGITVGRLVLGFVTPRVGAKVSTAAYIAAAAAMELVFWLVPEFYVSVVAVAFQGFFLGPLFPNVVLVASKLLPRHQHVVVIGFAAALGGCGAAVLPFLTGLLAQASGVKVLQPIILALLVALLIVWLCMPRINKKRD